jgi:hypothetical protein
MFIFKYVTHTPPKLDFLLLQVDLFTISPDCRIINTFLKDKCQLSSNELFNDAMGASDVILAFVGGYKNIGCPVFKL